MQRRALGSMSRLAIRRCGHTAVQRGASVDDLGCVWSVATCSSRPAGGPPATARLFCLPFFGRAAAQRSDGPAADRHREGAARHPSKRDDIVALRCLAIHLGRLSCRERGGEGASRETAAPGVGRMAGGSRRYVAAQFSRFRRTGPEIRALNGGDAPGRVPLPEFQLFSAALGELQNGALGTREGEATHAIVEAHPIRAEPLLSADNNRAVHQKKGPRAV